MSIIYLSLLFLLGQQKLKSKFSKAILPFTEFCRFEVEAPGLFMETITSTATLLEETKFSTDQADAKEILNQENSNLKKSNTINSLQQQEVNEEDKLLVVEDKKAQMTNVKIERNYSGELLSKTEWLGLGEDMPPTKLQDKSNLMKVFSNFKYKTMQLNRYDYPFDINDPRNLAIY